MLQRFSWPHFAIIETFWCSCLVASIGYAHGVQFVTALDFLMDLFSVYQRDDAYQGLLCTSDTMRRLEDGGGPTRQSGQRKVPTIAKTLKET
jgi:hypothetical protein